MDILFYACSVEPSRLSYPLASRCLKAAVESAEPPVGKSFLFEYSLLDDPVAAAASAEAWADPVIACSVYVWNRSWFEQFISSVLRRAPETVIVIGGPEVTAAPESFSDLGVTAVIPGEGEIPLLEFLRSVNRRKNQIIKADYCRNLSELTSPILSDPPHLHGYPGITWELTRGCPYACSFCYESKGDRSVRSFSIDRVRSELACIISSGVQEVFILDPTFNMLSGRAKEILHLLIDEAGTSIRFHAEIRAELLDEEMADLFAQLDCALQIGLQSSDPEVLTYVGRSFNPVLFAEKCRLLAERGITFGVDLIYGLPHDTLAGFHTSLSYATALGASNLDLFRLSVLPGTLLYDQAASYALTSDEKPPYAVRKTPEFPAADLEKAEEISSYTDLFYTTGEAGIWFPRICEALDTDGASLITAFGSWLGRLPAEGDNENIGGLQLDFICSELQRRSLDAWIPAAVSLIRLHQGFNNLLRTGAPQRVSLDYHPDELAELDSLSLKFFESCFERQETEILLYLTPEGNVEFQETESV